jgi:hypothetical protein
MATGPKNAGEPGKADLPKLPSKSEWKASTSISFISRPFGWRRSPDLRWLDRSLARYESKRIEYERKSASIELQQVKLDQGPGKPGGGRWRTLINTFKGMWKKYSIPREKEKLSRTYDLAMDRLGQVERRFQKWKGTGDYDRRDEKRGGVIRKLAVDLGKDIPQGLSRAGSLVGDTVPELSGASHLGDAFARSPSPTPSQLPAREPSLLRPPIVDGQRPEHPQAPQLQRAYVASPDAASKLAGLQAALAAWFDPAIVGEDKNRAHQYLYEQTRTALYGHAQRVPDRLAPTDSPTPHGERRAESQGTYQPVTDADGPQSLDRADSRATAPRPQRRGSGPPGQQYGSAAPREASPPPQHSRPRNRLMR